MALLQPGDLFPNGTASIELLSGSSTKITPTSQSGNAYVFFETDLISNPNTTQYLQGATFTDLTQSVGGVVDGTGYRAGIVTHPGSSFTLNVAQDIPTGSVLIKSTGNVGLNIYNFPLDYYPGAAAAYSIRQLNTSYTGSAVEVSRDVDTQVQDIGFTANGSLDSTALLEFATNSSQSLLDYATGSAAAYSLRKLSTEYTGSAIEVRRSSDDAVQDIGFDANGDLDTGSLDTFVNEDVERIVNGDFATDSNWTKGTGWSIADGKASSDGSQITFSSLYQGGLAIGQTHNFTMTITDYVTGSVLLRNGAGASETYISAQSASGTYTASAVVDGGGTNNTLVISASPEFSGSVSFVSAIQTTADGHVRTWYDQSGNNNFLNGTDTEQPLIVSGGSVITRNGSAAVQADGVDDILSTANSILSTDFGVFAVAGNNNLGNSNLIALQYGSSISSPGGTVFGASQLNGLTEVSVQIGTYYSITGIPTSDHHLYYYNRGGSSLDFAWDGEAASNQTNSNTIDNEPLELFGTSNFSVYSETFIKELIIFDSDQSSNRLGIESNINAYYDIYTNPSASAYVRTWYDQSGNTNDAIQTTDSQRPKIVNTGSLVLENGKLAIQFDGVDDELEDATVSIDSTAYSAYMVANTTGNTVRALFRQRQLGSFGTLEGVAFFELSNVDQLQNTFIDDGAGNAIAISNASISDDHHLLSTEFTTSSAALYVDGTSTGTHDSVQAGSIPLASVSLPYINIGGARFSRPWSSTIQEIILFDSDQSTNRTGIEAQINSFYKIYN